MHSDFVSADVPVSLLSVALVVFVLEGFQMTRHVAVLQGTQHATQQLRWGSSTVGRCLLCVFKVFNCLIMTPGGVFFIVFVSFTVLRLV